MKIASASLKSAQSMEWSWDQLAASSPCCLTPVGRECLVAGPLPGQRGRMYTDTPVSLPLPTLGIPGPCPSSWKLSGLIGSGFLFIWLHSFIHSFIKSLLTLPLSPKFLTWDMNTIAMDTSHEVLHLCSFQCCSGANTLNNDEIVLLGVSEFPQLFGVLGKRQERLGERLLAGGFGF